MIENTAIADNFSGGKRSIDFAHPENNPVEKKSVEPEISEHKILSLKEENKVLLHSNLSQMKSGGLKAVALTGGLASIAAFVFEFLPDSGAKTFIQDNIKRVIGGVFGAFGGIGTIDAVNRKDFKQTAAQLASIAIPNFLVPKEEFDDLTLYRGVDVGAMNFAAEADKLPGGKKEYENIGESFAHLFKAIETLFREMRKDPFKAVSDFKGGVGTMFWSMLTMTSPIVYKLTGKRLPAYLMRHAGGLIAEFGKLNPENLAKGAYKYFASGVLLFASSLINLIGSSAGETTKKLTEYITWAFNIFGKELQLAAISSGETSTNFRAKAVELNELPGLVFKHFFKSSSDNGYEKAEPIKDAEEEFEMAEINPVEEELGQKPIAKTYLGNNDKLVPITSNRRNYLRPTNYKSRTSSSNSTRSASKPASKPKAVSKPAAKTVKATTKPPTRSGKSSSSQTAFKKIGMSGSSVSKVPFK